MGAGCLGCSVDGAPAAKPGDAAKRDALCKKGNDDVCRVGGRDRLPKNIPTTLEGMMAWFKAGCEGNTGCMNEMISRACHLMTDQACNEGSLGLRQIYAMLYGGNQNDLPLSTKLALLSAGLGIIAMPFAIGGMGVAAVILGSASFLTGAGSMVLDCSHARDAQCGLDAGATALSAVGVGVDLVILFRAGRAGRTAQTVRALGSASQAAAHAGEFLTLPQLLSMVFNWNALHFNVAAASKAVADAEGW